MKINLIYRETEHPEGGEPRSLTITDGAINPLGYDNLLNARSGQLLNLPIEIPSARVVSKFIHGVYVSDLARVTANLVSPYTSHAISLVSGGWLPSSLSMTTGNPLVFLDRNLIGEITSRFRDGQNTKRPPDFIDLFADQRIRINPVLSVLEGNVRNIPTFETAQGQLNEICSKLQSALPRADIVVTSNTIIGLWRFIEESRAYMERMQSFLVQVAPSIAAPIAQHKIVVSWNNIFRIAKECGVPATSLPVLCALSVVVTTNGAGPAKRLLKPHVDYSAADAYNAICDLRALDLLITLTGKFPAESIQICTADRDLALLWCALNVFNIVAVDGGVTYEMRPHAALLPPPYDARFVSSGDR